MVNDKYAAITNAVYELIEFLPEDEPLKQKIKQKALEVLESLVLVFLLENPAQSIGQKAKAAQTALKDIEVLKGYLSLCKQREWISNVNTLILFKEYDELKEQIKPIASLFPYSDAKREKPVKQSQISQPASPVDNSVNNSKLGNQLSERQVKILDILNSQGKAQVSELQRILVNVSKRTLRRDLDELLKNKKVERVGEWNQIFYKPHKQAAPGEESSQNEFNGDGTSQMS